MVENQWFPPSLHLLLPGNKSKNSFECWVFNDGVKNWVTSQCSKKWKSIISRLLSPVWRPHQRQGWMGVWHWSRRLIFSKDAYIFYYRVMREMEPNAWMTLLMVLPLILLSFAALLSLISAVRWCYRRLGGKCDLECRDFWVSVGMFESHQQTQLEPTGGRRGGGGAETTGSSRGAVQQQHWQAEGDMGTFFTA